MAVRWPRSSTDPLSGGISQKRYPPRHPAPGTLRSSTGNGAMAEHDQSYKLLFSHREMVRDLLEGFVRKDWTAELAYDTLEKVSASHVSDDLRERRGDVIWRVRWREK